MLCVMVLLPGLSPNFAPFPYFKPYLKVLQLPLTALAGSDVNSEGPRGKAMQARFLHVCLISLGNTLLIK